MKTGASGRRTRFIYLHLRQADQSFLESIRTSSIKDFDDSRVKADYYM